MKVRKVILVVTSIFLIESGILAAMMFVLMDSKAYGGGGMGKQAENGGEQVADGKQSPGGEELTDSGEGTSRVKVKKGDKEVQDIYKENKKLLILVNAEHGLEESYEAHLRTVCNGRLQASEWLYDALTEMLGAASEEGYQYWIASAWRSREKQQKLVDEDVRLAMRKGMSYDDALEETYRETMPAGHSEHETGLALDILCSGNMAMDASQEREPGNAWLRKNSWRYGFVLRYPEDKEKVTGISYEPWHFRYVGKKAASFMYKHDMTLEELWELL